MDAFINLLEADANVEKVVISSAIPGNRVGWNAGGIRKEGAPMSESNQYRVISVGHDFMQTYDMEVIAGRVFSREFGTEEENIVFSRAATKLFGFNDPEEALGTRINFWGNVYTIIGVTEDYHQNSLRDSYDQLIFRFIPTNSGYYSIKYNGNNTSEVIQLAEEKWQQFFAGNPLEYFFLDDHFDKQYKADKQFGTVFTVFSVLAIFVACLGLFGLAAFMAAKRTKEIGIRKVLGATVPGILKLLSTDFLKLIVVAVLLAVPLAYFGMDQWLSTFAFRIDLAWYIFVIPALTVMAIALATVSFQTSRAAKANPVKSLRYE
jgi:putative ABC transport system permease protein